MLWIMKATLSKVVFLCILSCIMQRPEESEGCDPPRVELFFPVESSLQGKTGFSV